MSSISDFVLAHAVATIAILTAVGTLAGVIEKYTTGKVSSFAGSVAGALVDVVKILTNLFLLFGGQPPMSGRMRKLFRGPFDNFADGGVAVLGKAERPTKRDLLSDDSGRFARVAIGGLIAAALAFMLLACSDLKPAAAPTSDATACGAGYITETVLLDETPTIAGFEAKCGSILASLGGDLASIAFQVFESLATQYGVIEPASDAGKMKMLGPNLYREHAMTLRNAYAAKVGAK